jgi:hypothetical protein
VVLQVNVRPGEFVASAPGQAAVVLGDLERLHVRVDIDEHDIPRFRAGLPAVGVLRAASRRQIPLTFVRLEPLVVPKRSLTGDNTERVDTRVLPVIYSVAGPVAGLFVGQQLDVFISTAAEPAAGGES